MSPLTPARTKTSKGVCVCVESKSQNTVSNLSIYYASKAKQIYGDWYKLIHSHVEAKMTTDVLECIL